MRFKQTCMVCKKATITGGSDINANIFTQFRAFIKSVEAKGWQVLHVEEKEIQTICPFCSRRGLKELKKRDAEPDINFTEKTKKEHENLKKWREKKMDQGRTRTLDLLINLSGLTY